MFLKPFLNHFCSVIFPSGNTLAMKGNTWSVTIGRLLYMSKWRDIRPRMVTHTRNLCSAFNPSNVHTHSSEHTHTVNIHPEQWAAIYAAAPGEQFTPPTYNSCRLETRTFDYESDSLTIRPRLPLKVTSTWMPGPFFPLPTREIQELISLAA